MSTEPQYQVRPIRAAISTISVSALGDVCNITVTDQTARSRSTVTYTLTKDRDGKWQTQPDLKDEQAELLKQLAARTAAIG